MQKQNVHTNVSMYVVAVVHSIVHSIFDQVNDTVCHNQEDNLNHCDISPLQTPSLSNN